MKGDKRAVTLLSGGLDSATCLALAVADGFAVTALSFAYGQKARTELDAASRVAAAFGARDHRVVRLDRDAFLGSALTDAIPVPKGGGSGGIPVTYVPARNTVFLAYGLAAAESLDADAVYIGVNSVDYSGYPDCRPEFIAAFRRMADLATKRAVEGRAIDIRAPLQDLGKGDIIRLGLSLGVDYSLTVSCYDPDDDGRACGACESCRLRREGFLAIGTPDPTRYVPGFAPGAE
ncbi:MAG: 7-cyano-7-deazaguanine synthase QueC [Planctomycetota bacterium]|jgi:7-cyano-7-deazaguanine synthase|nr:7-cyano-7-deazaguanine synthase QueC [Planctomycetota bacterium]